MKIVQICLTGQYNPNLTYQDNMLAKYYSKMGMEVTTIATPYAFSDKGIEEMVEIGETELAGKGKLVRLSIKQPLFFYRKFRRYIGLHKNLEKEHPDVIFVHGCQFLDIDQVVKYAKHHPEVRIFADNHSDFSNSARNWISKNVLHGLLWKRCAQSINPYVEKFFGVLPARVDFLRNIYGLPTEKCELLVMGADDEAIEKVNNEDARESIRNQYGIGSKDFLIVSGGKIDKFKMQTLLLMRAVRDVCKDNLKLLVFGSIDNEIRGEFDKLVDNKVIQYIGWANAEQSYQYFAAADLVCFPGRHSVYWEQVAGMGIPMLVKWWEGTTHIDCGGNVEFLRNDSVEEITDMLKRIMEAGKYAKMKEVAQANKEQFLYRYIAQKSIISEKDVKK